MNTYKKVISKKEKNKIVTRIKVYGSLTLIFIAISLVAYGTYKVAQFFDHNKLVFESPVKFQTPVFIAPRETALFIPEVKASYTPQYDLNQIVKGVYQLESSSGKHDACLSKGQFNGYGYRWNSNEHMCFGSHEQVQSLVAKWFNDNTKGLTLNQSLCKYNLGKTLNSCTYSKNYDLVNK